MIGLVVLLLFVMTVAAAEKPTSSLAIPALPRLGVSQDVDQSDVADPYILPVSAAAAGDATPTDAVLEPMTATKYLRFATADRRSNVPTAVSTNLTDWTSIADALPNALLGDAVGSDHVGSDRPGDGYRLGALLRHEGRRQRPRLHRQRHRLPP